MVEAHIDAVSVLGGPCGEDKAFDFGQQDITKKIENFSVLWYVMLDFLLQPAWMLRKLLFA